MKLRKHRIAIEAFLLLVLLPLGIAVAPGRIPLLPVLLGGALFAFWRCRGQVDFAKSFSRPAKGWWKYPVLRSAAVGVFAVVFCLVSQPESFAYFPKNRTLIWVMVLCLYPVLSVFPQEIIYRFYLFEVVAGPLQRGGGNKWGTIIVCTLLFSWVHIVYKNAFALWGTVAAGLVLNWVYWDYRDTPGLGWRLVLEHSLYGLIIFTAGLGGFFFLAR